MWLFTQSIINGILAGGVYALIAVGITIIFGVMRLVNFASGAFFTLSMYLGYFCYLLTGWNCYQLIPLVSLLSIIVAYVTFRLTISPVLAKSRDATILVTVGLSFFLQNLVIVLFGGTALTLPSDISSDSLSIGGYMLGLPRTIAFVTALALVLAISVMINKTNFGRAMRATSESPEVAEMLGIKSRRIYTIAWIIGIVMTSIGGLMLTPIYYVNNTVGAPFRTVSLMAVVLGGLGDIRGAFICGLLLGVVESVLAAYFTANIGLLGIFVVYLVVFLFKPQGIFGRKERVG